MQKLLRYLLFGLSLTFILFGICSFSFQSKPQAEKVFREYKEASSLTPLKIKYPTNKTIFPPEIIAPKFVWEEDNKNNNNWLISVNFQDSKNHLYILAEEKEWTPSDEQWKLIKKNSSEKKALVKIFGFNSNGPRVFTSKSELSFHTSKDSVGAPIFYREVNLPFQEAVKDPSKIRWRFGDISSKNQPPIVLENLPVCGNCHSFSSDGSILGMDVDYANDKGSYAMVPTQKVITLDKTNIITWSDYKREESIPTYGLLSQVSPDGKYSVSTVKDRSVFVAVPNLEFSQLFFPVRGILAVYSRDDGKFNSLPGADDNNYVQSNPIWSPDGQYILFAKSEAITLKSIENRGGVLLSLEDCKEFVARDKLFKYDLYRIPFNNGKGGKAEPLKGASGDGMSNYFAKYSPDGRWIVFCKAKSFMLLQEDSELYIIPAEGGEARRLNCNTNRMNSWHSWSPNSKWIVFSSKANTPFTQLFLTHIDSYGNSSPAVQLTQFTSPDRAANIPEFVSRKAAAIKLIKTHFVDDNSYLRAAQTNFSANDLIKAEIACKKAIKENPNNYDAQLLMSLIYETQENIKAAIINSKNAVKIKPQSGTAKAQLGFLLWRSGQKDEGFNYLTDAVKLNPEDADIRIKIASALFDTGHHDEALKHISIAASLKTDYRTLRRIAGVLHKVGNSDLALEYYLKSIGQEPSDFVSLNGAGHILFRKGNYSEAAELYRQALAANPNYTPAMNGLAAILVSDNPKLKNYSEAVQLATKSCAFSGNKELEAVDLLSIAYALNGNVQESLSAAKLALELSKKAKNSKMKGIIEKRIEQLEKHLLNKQ